MIITSFGIGIVFGFIFFELSGLTAGGIIVPGYLALFIHEPSKILVTLLISLAVYGIAYFISQRSILFGRRRFFLMILLGFLLRIGFDLLKIHLPGPAVELQAIGYVIPGIIANEFYRQGVFKTLAAIIIVVSLVYLTLSLVYL
jgi:poly-gamma-glutamate biosynthesis protein PgsC/CapC